MTDEQNKLIESNIEYAKNIAAKASLGLPIDAEDAISVGYVGLVEAARRFDPDRYDSKISTLDTHFKSFAYTRIRGAVIDECRRLSFVRRRGLEKGLKVDMVSVDEMTEYGLPKVDIAALDGDPDLFMDFQIAMKTLTDREQKVVMAIAAGMKGTELAEELGVTESRVSQIATAAKFKLLEEMAA